MWYYTYTVMISTCHINNPNIRREGAYPPKQKTKKPTTEVPNSNDSMQIEISIMFNVMTQDIEVKLENLFNNTQKASYTIINSKEASLPQLPSPVVTDNLEHQIIFNEKSKYNQSKAINMKLY